MLKDYNHPRCWWGGGYTSIPAAVLLSYHRWHIICYPSCNTISHLLIVLLSSLEPSPILLLAAFIIETVRRRRTPSIGKRAYCNRVLQEYRLSLSGGCIYSVTQPTRSNCDMSLWILLAVYMVFTKTEDECMKYDRLWSRGVYLCLSRGGEDGNEENRQVVWLCSQ